MRDPTEDYLFSRVNLDGYDDGEVEEEPAMARVRESDAKLTASLRGCVYGPGPRQPVLNRKELLAALAFVAVVLGALGLFWVG